MATLAFALAVTASAVIGCARPSSPTGTDAKAPSSSDNAASDAESGRSEATLEQLVPATPTGKASAPDTFEPDGTKQLAHVLVAGGPVETHTLYKSGDIDWFAVDTTSTPHSMSMGARYDIEFAVYTESGREVGSGSTGGDNAGMDIDMSTDTVGGGLLNQRFYIRVSAPNPKDTPPFYYAIALE